MLDKEQGAGHEQSRGEAAAQPAGGRGVLHYRRTKARKCTEQEMQMNQVQ